jgi:hypothetical protein
MKGVELALDGADGPLLRLSSEGGNEGFVGVVVINDEESTSTFSVALIAFSNDAGVKLFVGLLFRLFCTRLRGPAKVATGTSRLLSEGQAHAEATKMSIW